MSDLITLATALVFWRVVAGALLGFVAALLLNALMPGFTAGHGLGLVIVASAFGIYWQERSAAGLALSERLEEPVISRPVAFMGFAFIGAIWGGGFTYLFGSALAGGLALCFAAALVALWRQIVQRRSTRANAVAFALLSLLTGFVALQLLGLLQNK